MSDETSQLPPHAPDAEAAFLSCLLQDQHCIADAIAAKAAPAWLYDHRHQQIYHAILAAADAGPVDLVTVTERLRRSNDLDRVGGIQRIAELADCAPSPANLKTYINDLRDAYGKRQLLVLASELTAKASNGTTFPEALAHVESGLLAIANEHEAPQEQDIKSVLRAVVNRMEEAVANRGRLNGLPTGFYDLDRVLRGMKPGQLIVLGGATSRGKTSLAMNVVERVAIHDQTPTAVFSLEMSREELALRLSCSMAGVSGEAAESGELSESNIKALSVSTAKISGSPLHICDLGGLTIARLCGLARRMTQRHGIKFIVVDYLQLLRSESRKENRTVEVGEISRGLKALAKELRVPILALAQLNRDYDKDGKRPPQLSDLRESGSIEQDADAVVFIHRPSIEDTEAEIIVAKNRNGRTGKLNLLFNGPLTRFINKAPSEA